MAVPLLPLHTVHLHGGYILIFYVFLIVPVKMPFFCNRWFGMLFFPFPGSAPDSLTQINVAHLQFTGFDKPAEGRFADRQILFVCLHNVVNRLSPFDEGADKTVDVVELFIGEVRSTAAVRELCPVFLLCCFGRIQKLFKMAQMPFVAAVTQMNRGSFQPVTKSLHIIRAVCFCPCAVFTLFGTAALCPADIAGSAVMEVHTVITFVSRFCLCVF